MQGTVAQAIEQAALDVFALVVGVDIVAEPHDQVARRRLESKIVSSFHLSGSISGTAHVYYTLPLAKRMTCRMLQLESPAEETDVLDAAGEVANMIVGNVKNSLENQWGPIQIGTPAVEIIGDSHERPQAMSVNFRCGGDVFTVAVAFQEDIGQWDS
jgi:CheY-specific phosphatase CheX